MLKHCNGRKVLAIDVSFLPHSSLVSAVYLFTCLYLLICLVWEGSSTLVEHHLLSLFNCIQLFKFLYLAITSHSLRDVGKGGQSNVLGPRASGV